MHACGYAHVAPIRNYPNTFDQIQRNMRARVFHHKCWDTRLGSMADIIAFDFASICCIYSYEDSADSDDGRMPFTPSFTIAEVDEPPELREGSGNGSMDRLLSETEF